MKYPEQYYRFFDLFNNEEFWESHEALEELWKETDNDLFLRGLIIFAAACVHIQRNNSSGCRKTLEKAVDWLTPYAPSHWDLDVSRVLEQAHLYLNALPKVPQGEHLRDHLPFIKMYPEEA